MANRTIAGLGLKNHLLLASGPLSKTKQQLLDYAATVGGIVGKSLDVDPYPGHPQPRIARMEPQGMLNYEGGYNPGIAAFRTAMAAAKAQGLDCPVIGSISLRTLRRIEEAKVVAREFQTMGCVAIELDLKYLYNDQSGRVDFGPEEVQTIVATLRRLVDIPLIAKIAYGSFDMRRLALAAQEGGAEYVSAINAVFPAMRIDLERRAPVLSTKYGALSGPAIRPLAIAAVHQLSSVLKVPVMGIGGVTEGRDVVEMLMAGAETVQIFTVAMREGPAAFTRILQEAEQVARELGFSQLDDCIGAAHKGGR